MDLYPAMNCSSGQNIIFWHFAHHRPQFERFLKDFFDEHERHLAENFHAFCVIL